MSIGFKAGDTDAGVELRVYFRPGHLLPISRVLTSLMFLFEAMQVY